MSIAVSESCVADGVVFEEARWECKSRVDRATTRDDLLR